MCGRTSLFVPPGWIADRFTVSVPEAYRPRHNIAPHDDLAVVRSDAREELVFHEWGLVPRWADRDHRGFINARAETVEEKPSFQEAAGERRCLVIADGFYEWQERTTGTQPFRVEREDREPFAMAGLFEPRGDGQTTVAVITTEPNDVVEPLHDRMAVVLAPDEEADWLDADDPGERAALLDAPPADGLHAYPVSTAINDPTAEGPELVEPVEGAADDPQTGLDDFE